MAVSPPGFQSVIIMLTVIIYCLANGNYCQHHEHAVTTVNIKMKKVVSCGAELDPSAASLGGFTPLYF